MRKIKLTQGKYTILDNSDYELLKTMKWFCIKSYGRRNLFYACRCVKLSNGKQKIIPMQNFILNPIDGFIVDHKDRNGLNNTRSNLRLCTYSQNSCNRIIKRKSLSGFRGVHLDTARKRKSKWRVSITTNKRLINLGSFKNKINAAKCYNIAALKFHGEFATLNKL